MRHLFPTQVTSVTWAVTPQGGLLLGVLLFDFVSKFLAGNGKMAVRSVKMYVDFWNFQLRWNEAMRSSDPSHSPARISWEKLPAARY